LLRVAMTGRETSEGTHIVHMLEQIMRCLAAELLHRLATIATCVCYSRLVLCFLSTVDHVRWLTFTAGKVSGWMWALKEAKA